MGAVKQLVNCSSQDCETLASAVKQYQNDLPKRVFAMLQSLRGLHGGFLVDQLEHSLQFATRLENDGADNETVLTGLCHDMGKAISWPNHAQIVAEILRPFVSEKAYWIVLHHQDFQGREFYHHLGLNRKMYLKYKDSPYFEEALRFSDLDLQSFDPNFASKPLTHFLPLIESFFRSTKSKQAKVAA